MPIRQEYLQPNTNNNNKFLFTIHPSLCQNASDLLGFVIARLSSSEQKSSWMLNAGGCKCKGSIWPVAHHVDLLGAFTEINDRNCWTPLTIKALLLIQSIYRRLGNGPILLLLFNYGHRIFCNIDPINAIYYFNLNRIEL